MIGNLVADPELRTTQAGDSVCSFRIAVNRRRRNADANQPEADFFRVSAWRQLGENCSRYLAKGRKVSVVGTVSASAYTGNDGQAHASLEVQADDVEFLTPKGDAGENQAPATARQPASSSMPTQGDDETLPF